MIWKGITKPVGFGKYLRTTTNFRDEDRSQSGDRYSTLAAYRKCAKNNLSEECKKAAAPRGRLLSKFILITN